MAACRTELVGVGSSDGFVTPRPESSVLEVLCRLSSCSYSSPSSVHEKLCCLRRVVIGVHRLFMRHRAYCVGL